MWVDYRGLGTVYSDGKILMYIHVSDEISNVDTYHDGSCGNSIVSSPPTLSDVRTSCFLTHCVEVQAPKGGFQPVVVLTMWDLSLQPVGQPQSPGTRIRDVFAEHALSLV